VKYVFMDAHRGQFRLAAMCRVLKVSRSGFYDWASRQPSQRSQDDDALTAHIEQIHAQYRQATGILKTQTLLQKRGIEAGKHRIARLRQIAGIETRRKKRFRVMRSYQRSEPAAPDLVERGFAVTAPNLIWVGDMTVLRTREGLLYLAVVLDLYARRVVGWAMAPQATADLAIAALTMAIQQRRPKPGLICHTDQGVQYASVAYRTVLQAHRVRASMSRRGNCHDNAVAESFFSNLKNELTHHTTYTSRKEAKTAIFDYIEVFYNRQRPHQTLKYQTPLEAEGLYAEA
jgi:putative transposase